MNKYLEVIYYDNDFGWPIKNALKRLWKFIQENNEHCLQEKADKYFRAKPLSRIFIELHKAKALQPLIERLYVLEYLASNVEFRTRGLYSTNHKWGDSIIKDAGKVKYTNDYLNIEVKIRNNDNFTKKWQNGEHAYLDLQTGEVNTF